MCVIAELMSKCELVSLVIPRPFEIALVTSLSQDRQKKVADPVRQLPYLSPLRRCGPQLPAQDLLENIREEADSDQQSDAQPGRPTGQHVYEYIVHPLIAEERPGWIERALVRRCFSRRNATDPGCFPSLPKAPASVLSAPDHTSNLPPGVLE